MASLTQAGITFGDGTSQTTAASSAFPAGTLMLFQQTAAPTGWTKQTAHDNKALRVVSGTAGSGGSVAFSTAFASQAVSGSIDATTLSIAQMPNHNHPLFVNYLTAVSGGYLALDNVSQYTSYYKSYASSIGATGGGGSHTHSFSGTAINMAVQYVDLIICSKA